MPAGRRRRAQHGLALVGDVTEIPVHSISKHHAARDVGRFYKVVRGAGREMLEETIFGGATSEQHDHTVLQLFPHHGNYRGLNCWLRKPSRSGSAIGRSESP